MRAFLSVYRLVALTLLFPGLVSCIESDSSPTAACAEACGSEETADSPSDAPSSALPEVPPETAEHDCTAHEIGSAVTELGSYSGASLSIGSNTDPDYFTLTAGAVSVDGSTAAVSPLVLYGDNAFPVLVDEGSRVFAAASRSGLGKVLAFGHDNYVKATIKSSDATKILLNAIPWMSNKPAPVIGLESGLSTLAATLNAAGYQTQYATPSQLAGVNVYINRGYTVYSDAEYTAIRNFVANGGGLIVGAQAWSFSGDVMHFSANKMLYGTGIAIAKLFDVTAGLDTVSATPPTPLLSATYSLQRLTEVVTGAANLSAADQALAASTIERAATILPLTVQEFYNQTAPFFAAVNPTITAANPVTPAANAPARAATRIRHKYTQELPPHEIVANPNAADFPGAIPEGAPRESVTVQIDGNYAGRDSRYAYSGPAVPVWRSTGTYAAPGEVVTVSVPPALVNNGVSIQIGSHTDLLWNKSSWVRFPAIVRSYPITAAQMNVASAFGGLIYITVPGGKTLGQVSVTLDNVVQAPLYVHGQTTLGDWLTIRDYPAPWAEIGSDKMIVMVPSSYIRTLGDPAQLMNRWDQIMDTIADLAAISHQRVRPERYLADRDISAGYMHAGYPIMGPLGEAANLVSHSNLAINWGFWHEVGHNHQWQPWVLQGTTESSVNWFSAYVSETLFNLPRAKGHTALTPESRLQRTQTYVANGKKYASWGSDAWLPLEMYLQLQQWFGWQPFIQVNADYLAISAAASPSADLAKVDQWTLRFAQKVGKNLGPFFATTWGLPVSQSVLDQMALLAPWPASITPPDLEVEPNDTCAQAQQINAPVLTGTYILSSKTDADWFVLAVGAGDVGKVVHAVTSTGQSNTDTVVEVFDGTCAGLNSLGGPSTNSTYHENWQSAPMTQSGSVYVKVT
ncbi:MAG: M60 family metallopeptidase, partial [Planctomycetes bacterium]|nr:M60 family metallopeptidase [Planctomycetota bacterium]